MVKVRAILRVKGDVQEAGYRALVMRSAQKLGLTGYVENLKDGTVRIICEGDENIIDKLIEQIKIKDEYIQVDDIEKSVEKPTNEFKNFEVKIEDLKLEMFQGYATAGKYFRGLGSKIDNVGSKVDSVGGKVDSVGGKVDSVGSKVDNVGTEVKTLRAETSNNFSELGEKYHAISKDLRALQKDIHRLVDYVGILIKERGEKNKDLP